jgi:outer membrane protein
VRALALAPTSFSGALPMSRILRIALLASALGAVTAAPAVAQLAEGAPAANRSLNFISLGAGYLPDYAGSDEYRVIPFGALRYEIGDVVIRSEGPGLALDFLTPGPLTIGVYGRWSGGRNEVDDAVVSLLDEVGDSIVVGGFVNLALAENVLTGFDRVSVSSRVGFDALGEFEGAAWSASANYATALSRSSFLILSASVSGFSDDYAETLFSVDAAGSAASGLQVFQAEGGVRDLGVAAVVDFSLGDNWSVSTVLSFSRLVGDFADSPIVAERGDENQFLGGLTIGRRF